MKLGCVVMAAGSASRFGANKLLQSFCGKPLCQWILSAIPTDVFEKTCVVTGYAPVAELAKSLGYQVVCNDRPELGISRTIALGLSQLLDCDGVVFMTADQPLLSGQTLCRLAEAFVQQPEIWAAANNGKRGNPCLFPQCLFPELMTLEGDTGGAKVIKAHPDLLHLLEVPAAELFDCDTAEALQTLEQGSIS